MLRKVAARDGEIERPVRRDSRLGVPGDGKSGDGDVDAVIVEEEKMRRDSGREGRE